MSNPRDIPLRPSKWLSETITYEGWGRAEFEAPRGAVEGPVSVRFAELSRPAVEMVIDRFECERTLRFGLAEFLSGATPVRSGDRWSLGIGLNQNTCRSITIRTDEGGLVGLGTVHFSPRFRLPNADPKGASLTFSPLRLEYNSWDVAPARYWVIPLVNFLFEPQQSHPALNQHPLRIYSTPEVPDGLPEVELLHAQLYMNQHNRLIIFDHAGMLGFVERVAGYQERAAALRDGQLRHAITAIMVGDLNSTPPTVADLATWPPLDLVPLLSLASGSEVDAPWVECRDATGRLVRRLHAGGAPSCFARGHVAIDERVNTGTGRLLTCAQASPEFRTDNLSVALAHLIRGGRHAQSLEDRLSHYFRALECLCDRYSLGAENLLAGLHPEDQATILQIIDTAAQSIRGLAAQATPTRQSSHQKRFERIAERVRSAGQRELMFGLQVGALLAQFNLADERIIDAYCQSKSPGTTWGSLLSKYRGAVAHKGYLDIARGVYDLDEAVTIVTHIHDVLVRIILLTLGYDGAYQPAVLIGTAPQPLHWVTPATPADRLGFS